MNASPLPECSICAKGKRLDARKIGGRIASDVTFSKDDGGLIGIADQNPCRFLFVGQRTALPLAGDSFGIKGNAGYTLTLKIQLWHRELPFKVQLIAVDALMCSLASRCRQTNFWEDRKY